MEPLRCNRCNGSIWPREAEPLLHAWRCPVCGALRRLPDESGAVPRRRAVPLPPAFEAHLTRASTRVTWQRSWPYRVAGVVIAVAFCSMAGAGALVASEMRPVAFSMLLGCALGGCLALAVSYIALVGLVNRTTLTASPAGITVTRGPLPAPGRCAIPAQAVTQIWSRAVWRHSFSHGGGFIPERPMAYSVWACLRDGSTRAIVWDLDAPDQALYLEQEIECTLQIQDAPVIGELPRESAAVDGGMQA